MKYRSVFDIIGPIMVGPSSSHTAGAARIGRLALKLFGKNPSSVTIHFYGSFAQTYQGHATDVAVVAGLLNLDSDDERLPRLLQLAQEEGMDVTFVCEEAIPHHPNTMKIVMNAEDDWMDVTAISVGGGAVVVTEVLDFPLKLSGDYPALLIFHKDAYGAVASVANQLLKYEINISHMEVSRREKGELALMVIETDQAIPSAFIDEVLQAPHINKVILLNV